MRLWCGNCRLTRAHRLNAIGALVCQSCGRERGPAVARRKCKDAQHSAMWRDGWARCVVCGKDMRPYRPNVPLTDGEAVPSNGVVGGTIKEDRP